MENETNLLRFPLQLNAVRDGVMDQKELLGEVADMYADAISSGGVVHVYGNGHSRMAVEETCVRMGALSGFHPVLASSIATFTDVIGSDGLRVNQFYEKVEGIGNVLLEEIDMGKHDVLVVVSATGTTVAAVDIALAFNRQYPELPLVCISSVQQAKNATPKHSSGKTLWHIAREAKRGYFIDNCMPMGDVTLQMKSDNRIYGVCPLSSIGVLTIVQSLNELTLRELIKRKYPIHNLANMHLKNTQENYDTWLRDQRKRFSLSQNNPDCVTPIK